MASLQSPKAPRARQARKSLAAMPSTDLGGDKENMTVDAATIANLGAQGKEARKKLRSISIGPGGLDALNENSGNKQVNFGVSFDYFVGLTRPSRLYHHTSDLFSSPQ